MPAASAQDVPVVHAEVPVCELAFRARVTGSVILRVTIDGEGKVTSETVEKPLPIAVRCAEAAAKKWTFAPADRPGEREAELTFVFDPGMDTETDEESHVVSSFDDPWTVRVAYAWSTILRLPRVNGEIPEKRCPVHDEVMSVETLPLARGLGCGSAEKEWLEAYADAREKSFPETHRHAASRPVAWETKEEVYYCQACRDAEEAWLRKHPRFHPDE
jgi:TonB family protein